MMNACHKRARPIVMTTLVMGAGMLPIAVGWGAADASFRSPIAVAVIGGLKTSTVVDDFGTWVKRLVFLGAAGTEISAKYGCGAYWVSAECYGIYLACGVQNPPYG